MATIADITWENNRIIDPSFLGGKGADSFISRNGKMRLIAGAAHSGSYGLEITPTFSSTYVDRVCFVIDRGFQVFRCRFYVHPSTLTMGSATNFRLIRAQHVDSGNVIMAICLGWSGSSWVLESNLYNGVPYRNSNVAFYDHDISLAWHSCEIHWEPNLLRMWIDGEGTAHEITCTGQNGWVLPGILFGYAGSAYSLSFTGAFYLDDIKANDDGSAIGT